MYSWYALQTNLTTKDIICDELKKAGYKACIPFLKTVLTFDVKKQVLYSHGDDDSLIKGYALVQVHPTKIEQIVSAITISKIGKFFHTNKKGIPYEVPKEEVEAFKKNIFSKKNDFDIGQKVLITDGLLSGMEGVILKKRKLSVKVKVNLPNRDIDKWIDVLSVVGA